MTAAVGGIHAVGVPQAKPMHWFPPNFQDMLSSEGSRAEYIGFVQYPATTVTLATLVHIFGSTTLCVFHRSKACYDFHQIF